MLAIDCSNYTGELEQETLARWREHGVGLVIVQAVNPPYGFPRRVDKEQAQAVLDVGLLALDCYVYHWTGTGIAHVNASRFRNYGFPVRRYWADLEDITKEFTKEQREDEIPSLLAFLDSLGAREPAGIYTGKWWVDAYLPRDTQVFMGRVLWLSQYDNIQDVNNVSPVGGGKSVAIKQYWGSTIFQGQSGVDLNVLSAEEEALVLKTTTPEPKPEPEPEPEPAPPMDERETPEDWEWPTWREAAINLHAIAGELGRQLEECVNSKGAK